jgi:DNA (cytosine-5)-methyltransferase 1
VTLHAVSLFAGVGGFDLAMQRAGINVVAAIEIDKNASKVLATRFPNTHLFNDVREVTGDQLRADGFNSDNGIITGGFPCQDLSIAGSRRGLAGERSGLFWQIVRLINELRPKWLILENVPGLLSSNGGRDMGTVVRALEQRGYGVCWRVLDAQYFGVAQRRRRLFFVCCLADHRRPVQILFEPESGIRHPAPRRKTKQETSRNIEAGTYRKARRAQSVDDHESWVVDDKTNTLNTFDSGDIRTTTAVVEYSLQNTVIGRSENAGPNGAGYAKSSEPMYTLDTTSPHGLVVRNTTAVVGFSHYQNVPTVPGHVSPTLGRESQAVLMRNREGKDGGGKGPWFSDKSLTLATAHDQTLFTNTIVRRLTPVECERLQGFPDDWTAGQADGQRYKQMGNAVAVPVAEWIIKRLSTCN